MEQKTLIRNERTTPENGGAAMLQGAGFGLQFLIGGVNNYGSRDDQLWPLNMEGILCRKHCML